MPNISKFAVSALPQTPRRSARVWLFAAALCLCPTFATAHSSHPESAPSLAQNLTPTQANRIGRQFLASMLRTEGYISDPELNYYISNMGTAVASNATLTDTTISVHLVEDKQLNAYALPGGHITLNTGLLTLMSREGELAAVVAHEVAHISQKHFSRIIAKSSASGFPTLVAVLASIAVGGEVGAAGLTAAVAASQSSQLAYTREFEREADAVGIKLLAKADYDPDDMARFFEKLGRTEIGENAPEFLRTHPLSWNRIAEAENRAALYPKKEFPPQLRFQLFKAKVRAQYLDTDHEKTLQHFQSLHKNASTAIEIVAAQYGIALALTNLRQYAAAHNALGPLIHQYPQVIALQIAQADLDLRAGKTVQGVRRYAALTKRHPKASYLWRLYAEALLISGEAQQAKRVVRRQLRRNKDEILLYPLLAKINGELGLFAETLQANANFHAALGEYQPALDALKQALRSTDQGGYLHQSISARIGELEDRLNAEKTL